MTCKTSTFCCSKIVVSAGPEAVCALFAKVVLARRAAAHNVLLGAVCEGYSVRLQEERVGTITESGGIGAITQSP